MRKFATSGAKVHYLRSMSEDLQIEFQKWEGTGNTFVVFDGEKYKAAELFELPSAIVQGICSRENTDGLIVLGKSEEEGVDMVCDFRNPDGTRSFCGNGTRAAYAYARREGWVGETAVFSACDGLHSVRWTAEYDVPSVEFRSIKHPVEIQGGWFVDTGSPHHLILLGDEDDISQFDIVSKGAEIRYSDEYKPHGTNVSAMCQVSDAVISLRTYEKGVEAETKACGTGAVAAALTDFKIRGGEAMRVVNMPGGRLYVDFKVEDEGFPVIWLSGAASEMRRGMTLLSKSLMWCVLVLGSFLFSTDYAIAQTQWYDHLSPETEVSILTATPGEDTYSMFGHTAIRIYDPSQVPVTDWVFNYGTFSFSEGFYLKFMKGQLDYKLTAEMFSDFQQAYSYTGRGLYGQKLLLSPPQIVQVAKYLSWNLKPENSVYSYEFFRDNCSSRIITVLEESLGEEFQTNCESDGRSFRDGLRPFIENSPWTELGMDFILGPSADKIMVGCDEAFIPNDLSLALDLMTVSGETLTAPGEWEDILLLQYEQKHSIPLPLILFIVLAAAIIIARLKAGDEALVTRILRGVVLIGATILGVLLLLMWTFTDHTDTWANLNLVWTIPAIFALFSKRFVIPEAIIIGAFLLLSPFIGLQFVSVTLWVVALCVFLTLTPNLK